MTGLTPCSTGQQCPSAIRADLVGCDTAQQKCVCQRGYVLEDGMCQGRFQKLVC